MLIDIHTDGHIHTSLCRHAVGTMEEYVTSAIQKGLRKIIFLEHLEEGINYFQRTWLTEEDFDYYFEEGQRLQKHYSGRIEICLGVEVGYNSEYSDRIVKRLNARKWDRIGISCHYCKLPESDEHLNLLSRKQENIESFKIHGTDNLLTGYFDALVEAVLTLPGDVLCHLDAGLRHCPQLQFNKTHLNQIERLLDIVKQKDMALEINTSGYDIRNNPFPMPHIIKQAIISGIKVVAGSDAHHPDQISRSFEKLPKLMDLT